MILQIKNMVRPAIVRRQPHTNQAHMQAITCMPHQTKQTMTLLIIKLIAKLWVQTVSSIHQVQKHRRASQAKIPASMEEKRQFAPIATNPFQARPHYTNIKKESTLSSSWKNKAILLLVIVRHVISNATN